MPSHLPQLSLALLLALPLPACAVAWRVPAPLAGLPQSTVTVTTESGEHRFRVWIAQTNAHRSQGLMFVEQLARDEGMLFLFERPQFASFWMKNTPLSLDIVFIGPDGTVVNVATHTRPHSLEPIESVAPVTSVLELVAGTAERIGLAAGSQVSRTAQVGKP